MNEDDTALDLDALWHRAGKFGGITQKQTFSLLKHCRGLQSQIDILESSGDDVCCREFKTHQQERIEGLEAERDALRAKVQRVRDIPFNATKTGYGGGWNDALVHCRSALDGDEVVE